MDARETAPLSSYQPAATPAVTSPYERQVRFLARTEAFRAAARPLLEPVAAALQPRSLEQGAVVCREGEPADELYVIESGTVAIFVAAGDHQLEIARLGPGQSFGEVSLLGGRLRTATVQAVTPLHLLVLAAREFHAAVARSPELAATMAQLAQLRDRAAVPSGDGAADNLAAVLARQSQVRIGRAPDNDIVLQQPTVSSHHALIRVEGAAVRLHDTSTNGTYVNGDAVHGARELHDGDSIVIGRDRFVFDRGRTVHVVEPTGIRIDALHLVQESKDGRRFLQDISLSILPGEFVAIVGGSGAGKTTLMDALAGIRPATGGEVLYNGIPSTSSGHYRQSLGYVPQDDIIHHEMTLQRTFHYAAHLRLPRDATKDAIDAAIQHAFDELGLSERADVRVGALSGGQRKRASIGIELLTGPRMFFLDEPTSGLDPGTETQIMRSLRELAEAGRTIILTTHATKNVMLCDRIIILARDGHLAFFGPPGDALVYFGVESFDDIYVRLAEDAGPEQWGAWFRSSPEHQRVLAEQQRPASPVAGATPEHPGARRFGLRHHVHEWWVLSKRNIDLYTRFPANIMPIVMQPVVFSLLLLALFESGLFDPSFPNPTAPLQLVFLVAFNAFLIGLLSSVQQIIKELPIFFRERNVGVAVVPYLLSKTTFMIPVVVLSNLVMLLILRVTNRLPSGGLDTYGPLFVSLCLVALAGMSLGLLTSAFVRTSQQATDLLSLWIMPQVLFAGALFAVASMNTAGQVISTLAALRWGFEASGNALDLNEVFRDSRSVTGRSLLEQYETAFSGGPTTQWIILGAFAVVPLVIAYVILRTRTPER